MDKKRSKQLIAMALVTPIAAGPFIQVGEAFAATSAPAPVTNPTIDWDTFTYNSITLLWDASEGATEYIVERNGEEVYRGPANRFTDNGLASGATYQYAIYAANSSGVSNPVVDYITTDEVYQAITINWLAIEGASGYLVERNGEYIAEVDEATLSYTDETALLGNEYRYKVVPIDGETGEPRPEDAYPLGPIVPFPEDPENPNHAPVSYAIGDIELLEGQSESIDFKSYFSDPDGDILSFSAQSSNSNTKVVTSGVSGNFGTITGVTEGSSYVLVTARDGRGAIVQRQIQVTVKKPSEIEPPPTTDPTDPEPLPNVAPTSEWIPDQTVELQQTKELDLSGYFHDEDGDALTFTATVNNNRTTTTVVGSKLQLFGAEQGVASVTVTADDDFGHRVSRTFNVNVVQPTEVNPPTVPNPPEDEPPYSIDIPSMEIVKGSSGSVLISQYFKDPNGDGLTYDVSYSNGNVTGSIIDYDYDTKSLNLNGIAVGQTVVTVTADDGKGNEVTESFTVKVTEPVNGGGTGGSGDEEEEVGNRAPIIEHDISNGYITIGNSKDLRLNYYFKDPDGDRLTYTVHGDNSNVAKAVSGDLLRLTGNREGLTKFTVYADDGNGHIVTQRFDMTAVKAETPPPFYKPIPILYGPDFVDLSWFPILGAAGYSVYLNNELMYTQPEDGSMLYYYRIDGIDPTQDNHIVMQPIADDGSPIGDPIDFDGFEELSAFEVTPTVDGNDLTVDWSSILGSEGYQLIIKDESGQAIYSKEFNASTLNHTYRVAKAGNYTVSVAPKKDGDYFFGKTADFTIAQDYIANNAPTVGTIPNITLTTGEEPYTFDVSQFVADADGDELTYTIESVSNTNASATISGSSITVTPNSVGTTYVKVRVSDGKEGGTVEKYFYVNVQEPVNHAPVAATIPDMTIDVDAEPIVLTGSDYFTDEDGDNLLVSVKSVSSTNVSATTDGQKVTIKPNKVGTAIVTLVATDEKGLTVQKSFNVTVKEVAPVAVTNLTAQAVAFNEVQLNFNTVANADEYIIKRNGEEVGRTSSGSYTDKSVEAETSYQYEVIAVNEVGESAPALANVETPAIPKVKNVQAEVVKQSIILTWDQFKSTTDKYRVYRYKKDATGEFVADNTGVTVTGTTFTDTGLSGSTEYKYEIVPLYDNLYNPIYAGSVTAITEQENRAPQASDIPVQTIDVDAEPLTLNGLDFFTDADGDELTVSVKTVSNSSVSVVASGTDIKITPNSVGEATVTLLVKDPEGASVEKTFVVKVNEVAPEAVTNLEAKALAHNEVEVNFTSIANADEYIIKRDGEEIARTVLPKYVDKNVVASTSYVYEVIAVNEIGESEAVSASVTTPALPIVQNVSASVNGKEVTVTWDAYEGATRYQVQRYKKDAAGVFQRDGFARASTGTTYVDTNNVLADTEYKYEIIPSVNGRYNTQLAGSTTATTEPEPPAPVEVVNGVQNVAVSVNGTTATVTWDKLTVNGVEATTYRLQKWVKNEEGEYVKEGAAVAVRNALTKDVTVTAGKDYKIEIVPLVTIYRAELAGFAEFTVSADNTGGETSAPVTDVPVPEEVVDTGVTIINEGLENTLTWSPIGEATRYRIYRYVQVDGKWKEDVFVRNADGTSFTDQLSIKADTEYKYVVVPQLNNVYDVRKAIGGLVTTEAAQTPTPAPVVVGAIENLTAVKEGTAVQVNWDKLNVNGTDVSAYRVQRWVKNADGVYVKDGFAPTVQTNSYKDTKPVAGKEYKYQIIPRVGYSYDESKASSVEITF